ncbi:MAG TPA: serine/threonine-protein kinase [Anaerolineaceae bacterium]|nr:serine/threonine-protein kinase [Anaerolineaceae bacterium]
MPFITGETVGPYQILAQLGLGGMASVYKAYHVALDRTVAIKALHPAFLEDPNFYARFQREARVVARLEHPNIVPIYDFSEDEGRPYLVMKFIEGETLKARLERGPLPWEELLRVVDAVGSALCYAHRQGILHRDIKPSNVLISQDGGIYLADFGLARIAQAGESTLSSDMMVGTPQYMSPEQAVGLKDLDVRTDVYSLGVMLYEMVVGQVPFSGDTPISIIHDQIYTPLPLPRQINPHVSAAEEQVLIKALAKERGARYPDVSTLVAEFHSAAEPQKAPFKEADAGVGTDLPVIEPIYEENQSIPVQSDQQQKKKPSQKRWPLIVAGILGLILICGFFAVVFINNQWTARLHSSTQTGLGADPPTVEATGSGVAVGVDLNTPVTSTPRDPNLALAQKALDDAYTLWIRGEAVLCMRKLASIRPLAGDNVDFYLKSGDQMMSQKAWPLAGAMYATATQFDPSALSPAQIQNVHQAVYEMAILPRAAIWLEKYKGEAVIQVASIRYTLYQGNTQAAKTDLDALLANPSSVEKFPEAKLLSAEIQIQYKEKQAARRSLKDLAADSTLPAWVIQKANETLNQIQ